MEDRIYPPAIDAGIAGEPGMNKAGKETVIGQTVSGMIAGRPAVKAGNNAVYGRRTVSSGRVVNEEPSENESPLRLKCVPRYGRVNEEPSKNKAGSEAAGSSITVGGSVAALHNLTVSGNAGRRLDAWLSRELADLSRTYIQKLIGEGRILVNDMAVPANYKVKSGDVLSVQVPAPASLEVKAEDIPLAVLFEDQDILVVNKPPGMVVHPGHGNYEGTLVNALLAHCPDLSGIGGVCRPGIVHRLDKDTSGLLMVAKNDRAHQGLAEQIKERSVIRRYLALVHGRMEEPAGRIETPIGRHPKERKKMAVVARGGKLAITHYRVLERFSDYTLIEARLETGRTHQIRVHLAYLGHPVAGDPVYGYRRPHLGLTGQALHAGMLGFKHPRTGEELQLCVPVPPYFQRLLEELRRSKV